jgi:hypothetical protein
MKDNKTRDGSLGIAGYGVGFYLNLHRKIKNAHFSILNGLDFENLTGAGCEDYPADRWPAIDVRCPYG